MNARSSLRSAVQGTTLVAILLLIPTATPAQTPSVDADIPPYHKTGEAIGTLNSIGSDTLNNLMTLWAEGFRARNRGVEIGIEGKGSSTAPPALIEGTAQIGPMSRKMKAEESEKFEARFGYPPTAVRVAVDALAVYVNKDNPLQQLTIPQVDAIFSRTLRCGAPKPITTWREAGVSGALAAQPIRLYGRNSASGTYGYFKENALCKGDYKDTVKEQPGSSSVVQGVSNDLQGIGYSGIGYKTSGVKTLALAKTADAPFYGTGTDDVLSGNYPLARYLYLYVNKAPGKPLDPTIREFLNFVLSADGQQIVVKDGYLPISHEVLSAEVATLD